LFNGKKVSLCVTGGIAAYKAAEIVSWLRQNNALVIVAMTESACRFITPLTMQTLSGQPVMTDIFDNDGLSVPHIELAKTDLFAVIPATANIMAKAANGLADDLVSAAILATKAPLLFAPAMNVNMYENPHTQANINYLAAMGAELVEPAEGYLACGDVGRGRLASPEEIKAKISAMLLVKQDLAGKTVLVTAGPTIEAIDPVRYLANRSSGKMGYAIAKAAKIRGAKVVLITGPTKIAPPAVDNVIAVQSAAEMRQAVLAELSDCDIVIKAAAVADYRPAKIAEQKIKKNDSLMLELVKNPDILHEISAVKGDRFICGFAAETENLRENALLKLKNKNLDLLAANPVAGVDNAFGSDENRLTLFFKDGQVRKLDKMTKNKAANCLLDAICELLQL